ncbi:vitamin D3 receptor B-like isoform X2 [Tubulanus polymorphus]|uniref:vitamin D3 receptor B-like isoform X2 n=1 Tax=Tubulanus polymorphus TaxID=672921 RepID=UPI003DA27F67
MMAYNEDEGSSTMQNELDAERRRTKESISKDVNRKSDDAEDFALDEISSSDVEKKQERRISRSYTDEYANLVDSTASSSEMGSSQNDLMQNFNQQIVSTTTANPMKQIKKNKICLVCGDKAIGCNFGVISCESCKAFFRRMAFRIIKGRCQGKCEVNTETRVYCKSCRLNKCFAVGMKKHMILSDDEKRRRSTTCLVEHPVSASNTSLPVNIKKEINDDNAFEESSTINESPPSTSNSDVFSITAEELELIDELNDAFDVMYNTPTNTELTETPSTLDIVNMADKSIRKIIKSAKSIKMFCVLNLVDQIEVLKHCAIELLLITSIPYFDLKTERWFIWHKQPQANIVKTNQFKMEGNEQLMKLYGGYIKFVSVVNNLIRGDRCILNLLTVICLFNAEILKTETRLYNERAQEKFAFILQRYIEIHRPGEQLFPKLIVKLMDLQIIKEQHAKLLSSMHVNDIEPLLRELFNLST